MATTENDDAGGGRRGLRAAASPALLEALRGEYGIGGAAEGVDLGGSSSLNLRVSDGGGRYVARVYRPHMTAARLADIQRVRRHLADGGVPCAEGVAARDGRPWIVVGERLVEVERFVATEAKMDCWDRLEAGLPLLGRMHALLRGVAAGTDGKTPMFANHVEPWDALERTLHGAARIRGWGPSPGELRLADEAEELAELVHAAEQEFIPLLPRQLVHGDFWDNNVLFRAGRAALVTDFDFMGERARIDDLALTLYFALLALAGDPASNDPMSDETLGRLRGLVDAYDQSLDTPLSPAERAALPFAVARQPLWSVGVWVALLDDAALARRHAAGLSGEIAWALRLMRDQDRWQSAFG